LVKVRGTTAKRNLPGKESVGTDGNGGWSLTNKKNMGTKKNLFKKTEATQRGESRGPTKAS